MKKIDLRQLSYAAVLAALTAIGAFIRIPLPFYPVPFSLQTLFVMMAGLLLSPRYAFYSQFIYVALGLLGLPVFVGGGGIGYVLQPTFGYLLGFMASAPLCSVLVRHFKRPQAGALFSFLLCSVLVNALGVAYTVLLTQVLGSDAIAPSRVLYLLLIFLPLDAVKTAIASSLALVLKRRLRLAQ